MESIIKFYLLLLFTLLFLLQSAEVFAENLPVFAAKKPGQVVLTHKQTAAGRLPDSRLPNNYHNEPISGYSLKRRLGRLSRPIGRLDVRTNVDTRNCTAFFISNRHILTNYHCVPGLLDDPRVRKVGVTRIKYIEIVLGYLNYGVTKNTRTYGIKRQSNVVNAELEYAVEASKELDYAILEVIGNPVQKFGKLTLATAEFEIDDNMLLMIIGHPGGIHQHMSREGCKSSSPAIANNKLRHECDTLGGNSGSPVFDLETGKVIALHHAGDSLAGINFAIPMSLIIEQSPILRKLMRKRPKKAEPKVAIGVFPKQPKQPKRLPYEPEVVYIPGGTFKMGCVSGKGCQHNEKPVHGVTVGSFYLAKYEATVGQFKAFAKATGYKMGKCNWPTGGKTWRNPGFSQNDNQPVVCVSWDDAVAYAKWLSRKTGQTWRLPREAEWEYAARGDKNGNNSTKYSWGNNIGQNRANCYGDQCQDKWKNTSPIGSFSANGFGLHDMHGNVWEWVSDWKGKYKSGHQTDPKGPEKGSYRVYRGGGWRNGAKSQRSAYRYGNWPGYRNVILGFRLLRQL